MGNLLDMATICEQFPGRLRDLCEGQGRDGRPDPPLNVTQRFRAQYGLSPLSDDPVERSRQLAEESDVIISLSRPSSQELSRGPGRKLQDLFQQLAIEYREDCGCPAYARQMDAWGVAGCQAHFDEIVERLRSNAAKYCLWDHISAGSRALWSGLAFQVNPFDPFPGLVTEAIRQAGIELRTE